MPDHVLNKPGALTPEELAEMRKHPALRPRCILNAERDVGVRDDRDPGDGEGHRLHASREVGRHGLSARACKGDDIPIPGRVMAVVDVYDAIPHGGCTGALSHDEAVALIVGGRGTHFDPDVVDAFVRIARNLASVGALTESV